jgi:diol dehydratase reactivase alpha subunit
LSIVAGIDIGNSTTEVALAECNGGTIRFLSSALHLTTGIKGTVQNVRGIRIALGKALEKAGWGRDDFSRVDLIRLNEASPVIGDVAMETVTETIITESTMIGHNPSTPGGIGIGVGKTVPLDSLERENQGDIIVVIPASVDYETAASSIRKAMESGKKINGVICQADDGVLIANRLSRPIPIVDEVKAVDRVPMGMNACIEVAPQGRIIESLSNPYDVASIFELSPEETKQIVPVTRALVGNRSAVVIRTPLGEVKERRIPAGELYFHSDTGKRSINVDEGSEKIMALQGNCETILDIFGQPGTNVGGMMERVRKTMSNLTSLPIADIHIRDLLAVDTLVPHKVVGGLADEFSQESGVALAVMVETEKLPMQAIAQEIKRELGITVEIGGVEADMAVRGALTTPGTKTPVAILDLGAGSTDASLMKMDNSVELIHLAGAGNMVNTIISSELGFDDPELAESIKRYPLCKVESVFHIRQEDGTVRFFDKPLDAGLFGRVALVIDDGIMQPIPLRITMEKVRQVRRKAKMEVFVKNAIRALERVAPARNIRLMDYVVLVGGSAKDFEIPNMITDALSRYGVVAGRGNIRGSEGPRNAVATGLVLSYGGK